MTENPQEELEERIAEALWTELGDGLVKCIVRQIAPEYDPKVGDVLQGALGWPFVSVSSIAEEQFDENRSYDQSQHWVRPVTVALIQDKESVVDDASSYRTYRFNAMRVCNLKRFGGAFGTEGRSCILSSFVRPKSPVNQSAWISHAKLLSAFDVRFRTLESDEII